MFLQGEDSHYWKYKVSQESTGVKSRIQSYHMELWVSDVSGFLMETP